MIKVVSSDSIRPESAFLIGARDGGGITGVHYPIMHKFEAWIEPEFETTIEGSSLVFRFRTVVRT